MNGNSYLNLMVEDRYMVMSSLCANVSSELANGFSIDGNTVQNARNEMETYHDETLSMLDALNSFTPEEKETIAKFYCIIHGIIS